MLKPSLVEVVSASSGAEEAAVAVAGQDREAVRAAIDHDEVGLAVAEEVAGDQADRQRDRASRRAARSRTEGARLGACAEAELLAEGSARDC